MIKVPKVQKVPSKDLKRPPKPPKYVVHSFLCC